MAQGIHCVHGPEKVRPPVCALGSAQFAVATPVTIDTNGFLAPISSSGEKIWGYCTEDVTAISTNSSGSTAGVTQQHDKAAHSYAPRIIEPDNVDFWADSDQAMTQTDIGAYADVVSVSAGVVTINLAAGASGQFHVIGLLSNVNQLGDGDTDRIIVRAAEPQDMAFAQA